MSDEFPQCGVIRKRANLNLLQVRLFQSRAVIADQQCSVESGATATRKGASGTNANFGIKIEILLCES